MIPTDAQMLELVEQRNEHARECNHHPTYDLTRKGRIKLTCLCGWSFSLEAGVNTDED